jgi:hypothetical protein
METVSGGDTGGEWPCDDCACVKVNGIEKSVSATGMAAGFEKLKSKRAWARYESICCTVVLQQECESAIIPDPQLSAICWQHSRSASVRVSETRQAINGVPHTHRANMMAASLHVHFNLNSLIALSPLPQSELGFFVASRVSPRHIEAGRASASMLPRPSGPLFFLVPNDLDIGYSNQPLAQHCVEMRN